MKILIHEIPEEGLTLNLDDRAWVPPELLRMGNGHATVHLKRDGNRVFFSGTFSTTVLLECDRCLGKYEFPLKSDFRFDLELVDKRSAQTFESDHCCHENEMDMMLIDSDEIDPIQLLQQQVYLSLPMKKLCSEGCRGICEGCGANLNEEQCQCKKETSSPFDVLAKLKKP